MCIQHVRNGHDHDDDVVDSDAPRWYDAPGTGVLLSSSVVTRGALYSFDGGYVLNHYLSALPLC